MRNSSCPWDSSQVVVSPPIFSRQIPAHSLRPSLRSHLRSQSWPTRQSSAPPVSSPWQRHLFQPCCGACRLYCNLSLYPAVSWLGQELFKVRPWLLPHLNPSDRQGAHNPALMMDPVSGDEQTGLERNKCGLGIGLPASRLELGLLKTSLKRKWK